MATTPVKRKVRSRKPAAKTTPRKGLKSLDAKTTPRKVQTSAKAHTLYANGAKTTRYDSFDHNQTSAYSVGGLEVLGLVNMAGKAKSIPKAGSKERTRSELKSLFGNSMVTYWIKAGWLNKMASGAFKITVHGLNRISDRLNNPSDHYGTTPDDIQKMEQFIRTGKGLEGHTGEAITID